MIASLLAKYSGEDCRGYMLGLSESVDVSTGIFAPLLGGLLYDYVSQIAPAFCAGCLSLLATVVALGLPDERRRPFKDKVS